MSLPFLLLLGTVSACRRPSGGGQACGRIIGVWRGEGIRADAGADPEAVRVMTEVMRGERWRITKVTPTGLQRERVPAYGGRPIGEAMYVREDSPTRCVVELRVRGGGTRTMTFEPHGDGTMAVHTQGGWFTMVFRSASAR